MKKMNDLRNILNEFYKDGYVEDDRLNKFRCEDFDNLDVDWEDDGGVPIYKFANQID